MRWVALSKGEQIAQVQRAVGVKGLSYADAAARLGATKGMIAGICHRNKIKKPTSQAHAGTQEPVMHLPGVPMRTKDEVQARGEPPKVLDPMSAPRRDVPKVATSEATQCMNFPTPQFRCAFERENGDYCRNCSKKKK